MLSMNKQLFDVMQKRSELLAKIALQREQVAEIGTRLQTPLALADQGLVVMRFLRSNSVFVTAVVALFAVRRRGVVSLARSVWRMWKGYRYLTALSVKLSPRL